MNQEKECDKCYYWIKERGVCRRGSEAYYDCKKNDKFFFRYAPLSNIKEPVNKPVVANDNINHPAHYTQGKIECIDYILDKQLDYLEGNVVKYVTRWKHKNGLEDLKKAQWYMNKLVEREKNK